MKASKFKTLTTTLFILVFSISFSYAQHKETKEFKKEFNLNKASTLSVSNTFGDINILNWDKNTALIEVSVEVEFSSEKKAKEVIQLIDVNFNQEGDLIKANTVIENELKKIKNFNTKNSRISIQYEIKVPKYINVNIDNKFGNVFIDRIDGHADISVKFGTLKIYELSRGNQKPLNNIYLAYSSDESKIENANWLNITSRYSELRLNDVKALAIDSKYSEVTIDKVNSVAATSAFDEYDIDNARNISIQGGYTEVEIGKIYQKLELQTKYGEVNVNYIDVDFEEVTINGKYTDIEISIDPQAGYKLNAMAKYGNITFPSHIKVSRIKENTQTRMFGTIGSGKGNVNLTLNYGSIEID